MAQSLSNAGIHETWEQAAQLASSPYMVSRTHFGRVLIERGVCSNMQDVFQRFLIHGRPGYVSTDWASLKEAVGWINGAGGVAVLAHPGRYRLDAMRQTELLKAFCQSGGKAIEVVSGSQGSDLTRYWFDLALKYGLQASRGSDFHAPNEGRYDLGEVPSLPSGIEPVWRHWV